MAERKEAETHVDASVLFTEQVLSELLLCGSCSVKLRALQFTAKTCHSRLHHLLSKLVALVVSWKVHKEALLY